MSFPILSFLTFFPLVGVIFILLRKGSIEVVERSAKNIAVLVSLVNFFVSCYLWSKFNPASPGFQFVEESKWIANFATYKMGVDGISIFLVILTTFISPICIFAAINSLKKRTKEFLIAILVMQTFMVGVFCALDLFLFFLFFEGGLIPMFLIIGIWGGERRVYSALKFFLYTFLGSIFLLIAIIAVYWNMNTLDIAKLLNTKIPENLQTWLWLGFFISLAIKLPMWPFHTWLPDAHVEAPTPGSVILATILLKISGYGFIRFSLGLFPIASHYFANFIFVLSIIGIIYASLVALMQTDMKKLIAYSSVAHMGYVTIGIFSFTKQGMDGAIFQMISHGVISASLFLCVGVLYDRVHSRLIKDYSGLVNSMPRFAFMFVAASLANVGLPGTSGFIGEFLVLIGTFKVNYIVTIFAASGVILSAAYSLWLCKRVVFGQFKVNNSEEKLKDLDFTEIAILFILMFVTILLGIYPNIILEPISSSVDLVVKNITTIK
ncbi:MAG: NADH-quinone oxidoreductase subunit M [Pelagibacterales bacterium]|nr:NADH-quinone oxidoreductase subunit M [Pelagibacterales bacterium]